MIVVVLKVIIYWISMIDWFLMMYDIVKLYSFLIGLLIFKYEPNWQVFVDSLVFRWPLRPVDLFFIFIAVSVLFSSPELKAQVSFSDRRSSVVCLSVPPSVCPSVCLSVNFSYFRLLLQNHWANFNQTWHKASLGREDSSLFKWRVPPVSKGR